MKGNEKIAIFELISILQIFINKEILGKSMKLQRHGLIKSTPSGPNIDIIGIHRANGNDLVVARFGPGNYTSNQEQMSREYTHTSKVVSIPVLTFTPSTTAEAIEVSAYDFRNIAMPKIFDTNWLQAGYIIKDFDGVWFNRLIKTENQ